ncbi:MAG: hypothetical protein WCJ66_08735 [Verrucomicrobiota bacterium]
MIKPIILCWAILATMLVTTTARPDVNLDRIMPIGDLITERTVPLLDAQRAIRMLRFRAHEWGCDPARIGNMGFSAGCHLAATAGTHFDAGDPSAKDPIQRLSCRPDFAILVYPVISMGQATHGGSKENLRGANPSPESVILS